jgi:hypothetical protein
VLRIGGLAIPVITGGPPRNARLSVNCDGGLILRAAPDVSMAELREFVTSKRAWIVGRLSERDRVGGRPPEKELVDGEAFSHLGRNYRLSVANVDRVRLTRGRLMLPQRQIHSGGKAIVAWYADRARAWLPERAESWAVRLRVRPSTLEVADLGRRWGSAHVGDRVRFHWAVMQLPPLLIDYVLAHELAHLREPDHGLAFWRILGRAQPDHLRRKAELAEAGGSVWLGEIAQSERLPHQPRRSPLRS